jgi:hypothetical protein
MIVEILLVSHGGNKNDTIVTIEKHAAKAPRRALVGSFMARPVATAKSPLRLGGHFLPNLRLALLQGFAVLRHVETLHFVLFADTQRNDERNRLEQKKSDNARPCECRGDAIKLQT